MLLVILGFQIFTGVILRLHYSSDITSSFSSIVHIIYDVNYGSILRISHANGASLFFIVIYVHTCRGIYYKSYLTNPKTWVRGISILLILIATAFLGYVLPWGQMSYWGATVITNLFSAVPYIGTSLVTYLWGSYRVRGATLNRFYSFHFLFPFILLFLSIVHLTLLHEKGSSNPLGNINNFSKISFHPYFTLKDIVGFALILIFLMYIVLYKPFLFGDCENFIEANSLVTPIHIQPEWYFLIAYAILRAIPNKLGGVVALALSILILLICPFIYTSKFRGYMFYPINKWYFWVHINVWILLTWLGSLPIEEPYIILGQIFSVVYFLYYFLRFFIIYLWDKFSR